jgi:hypothetical protein
MARGRLRVGFGLRIMGADFAHCYPIPARRSADNLDPYGAAIPLLPLFPSRLVNHNHTRGEKQCPENILPPLRKQSPKFQTWKSGAGQRALSPMFARQAMGGLIGSASIMLAG